MLGASNPRMFLDNRAATVALLSKVIDLFDFYALQEGDVEYARHKAIDEAIAQLQISIEFQEELNQHPERVP